MGKAFEGGHVPHIVKRLPEAQSSTCHIPSWTKRQAMAKLSAIQFQVWPSGIRIFTKILYSTSRNEIFQNGLGLFRQRKAMDN